MNARLPHLKTKPPIQGDLELMFYRGVGQRIKDQRQRLKMSANTLARLIGLSRGTMLTIEKGRKFPLDWFVRLCRALQTSELYPPEHPWSSP